MRSHHRILAAFAGLLLFCAAGTAAAQSTIRCESQDGNYRSCPVSTTGGVTLTRQLSSKGCWQGDTWGYDRNRIWVTHGCRAEFRVGSSSGSSDGAKVAGALVLGAIAAAAIASHDNDRHDNHYNNNHYNDGYYNGYGNNYDYGYGNNSYGREIRCESQDGRYRSCGYIDRRGHAEIRRQLSNTSCVYGRSWGVDGRQLWVDDGCRAIFVVY